MTELTFFTFAQNYDPYGVITTTAGTSHSEYGFTGERRWMSMA